MLEIRGISKKFGSKQVLSDITVSLDKGVYGLLGKNGAGKTTLLNIITGQIKSDCGEVEFDGKDIFKHRNDFVRKVGYMPQYVEFYKNYSVYEFMRYMCVLKDVKGNQIRNEIESLLRKVNLLDEADKKIKFLSGGMRQRLGIAQALINNPSILFLDEPTAGLDPEERIRFRNLIADISGERIVILATHIVGDVEYIANKVLMLSNGKIELAKNPREIKESFVGKVGVLETNIEEANLIKQKYTVSNIYVENNKYYCRIVSAKLPEGCQKVTPTLEDVFIYMANEGEVYD